MPRQPALQPRQRLRGKPIGIGRGELADEGEERDIGEARCVAAEVRPIGKARVEFGEDGEPGIAVRGRVAAMPLGYL